MCLVIGFGKALGKRLPMQLDADLSSQNNVIKIQAPMYNHMSTLSHF